MVGLQPVSDSVGMEWDPSDVYVAGPGTTLSEPLFQNKPSWTHLHSPIQETLP